MIPLVNGINVSHVTTDEKIQLMNSNATKFDLSTLTDSSLNETFTETPTNNTLIRSFFDQYSSTIGGTYYNQVSIINDATNNKFTISAYDWAPNLEGSKTDITYIVNITPITDLSTIFGDDYTLYKDPQTSPWKTTPSQIDFLQTIKQQPATSNLDLNEVDVKTENMQYDTTKQLYYLVVLAPPNSNKYSGSTNVYFALHQKTVNLLGLNFKFDADISDANIPTASGSIITLNYDGEYNVTDDGTGVSNRSINVPNNYTNTSINLVGNTININPTSGASSITLGENVNANIKINAPTLNLTGAPGYAGIRVPYSSTLTLDGSSNITCNGGATGTRCGAGIGGVVTSDAGPGGDNSILNCGTVNILGTVSITAYGKVSTDNDRGGASAGIGGAGCLYGYAGKCKSVYINTTGVVTAKGGGYNNSNYVYGGSAPGIGGGNVGYYGTGAMYGGDLENIEIRSGTIIVSNGDANSRSIGSGSVIGGGSAVDGMTSGVQYIAVGGSLRNFIMTGGTLICKETTGTFLGSQYYAAGAIIGGGGTFKTQSGTPTTNSNFTSGGLDNFEISGGSIYLIKNLNRDATQNVKATLQTIGRGSINFFQNPPADSTCHAGSIGTFKVNNASIMMNKYVVDKQPVDENNNTLYPCYVPNTINGDTTYGNVLVIPSAEYSVNLVNFTDYDSTVQYSGVIYLPVGTYNDIYINNKIYHANVTAVTSPTATDNIVLS